MTEDAQETGTEESRAVNDRSAMASPRHKLWKCRAVLILVLVGIVGAVGVLMGRKPERREFGGIVHPISGARCRFTLSSDWQILNHGSSAGEDSEEVYTFTAPPPNPVRLWIDRHLLHRVVGEPAMIYLTSYGGNTLPGYIPIKGGFPEPVLGNWPNVRTHRHLQIDGSPATFIEMTFGPQKTLWGEYLVVYGPDRTRLYTLGCSASLSDRDRADREMQAILASFHIERVAVPAAHTDRKSGSP